jgi:hypothetical protein
MHPVVDMLRNLVKPPEAPVGRGTPKQWRDFERDFGFPFPDDFQSLIKVFGEGGFFDEIGICSPFSPHNSFIDWHEKNLEFSGPKMFPLFQSGGKEGLLQIGADCNGGKLFLLLRDDDAATFAYGNRANDTLHLHCDGIASYLWRIASGREWPPSYELNSREWQCVFEPTTAR